MATVFGIDSHKSSLAVCGVDELGRELCSGLFANTEKGHRALLCWAKEQSGERRFGVEGTGGLARALTRMLVGEGELTVEVPGVLSERERRRLRKKGKSDPQDALAIARVAAREASLEPLSDDTAARELKLLCDYREQLTAERTRHQNRLHADLLALSPGYEQRCPNLVAKRHLAAAAQILRGVTGVQAELARRRLGTLRGLDRQILELERRINTLVTASGSSLNNTRRGWAARGRARARRGARRPPLCDQRPLRLGQRHRADPSFLRCPPAPPAQPRRQPPTQSGDPHHGPRTSALRPASAHLHRAAPGGGQELPRRDPLAQTAPLQRHLQTAPPGRLRR